MKDYRTLHLVDTCDGVAFLVGFRITAADQHDADSSTLVKRYLTLVKVALGNTLKQIDDVTLQTQHHALCLWVTHATIVFNDHRLAFHVDESEEDKTFIINVLGLQTLNGRLDDAVFHFLHPFLGGKGYWRDAAHTSCVQSFVAFTNAFVVLGLGQDLIMLTIGQHEHRALYTTQELLDDHATGGIAKHTAQHLLQLFLGFFKGGEYQHALSCAQTVGLQHIGSL